MTEPPHDDLDFVGHMGEVPVLVPDGTYTVGYHHAERGVFAGLGRIYVWFTIVEPSSPYEGRHLYMSCPEPKHRRKSFGWGSKFVQSWMLATGQRPARRDRLSTAVFRGVYFVAKVRMVTKDADGIERPKEQWYSIIERLIARAAGTSERL